MKPNIDTLTDGSSDHSLSDNVKILMNFEKCALKTGDLQSEILILRFIFLTSVYEMKRFFLVVLKVMHEINAYLDIVFFLHQNHRRKKLFMRREIEFFGVTT